ncbi:MAG: hypothetical protein GEV08_01130 [Acidimicrobiia bacterium]|nr:hypothetical protein [Acidimicrobiia bacterium]
MSASPSSTPTWSSAPGGARHAGRRSSAPSRPASTASATARTPRTCSAATSPAFRTSASSPRERGRRARGRASARSWTTKRASATASAARLGPVAVFLVIGFVGLALLAAALLFGDIVDGLLGDIDLGDGLFSLPALAGAVAALGFGAAIASGVGAPSGAAWAVGVASGGAMGWLVARLTRSSVRMRTDEPLRHTDMVGKPGRVVNDIRAGQLGEVLVSHAGQSLKMSARSARELPVGAQVVVIEAESPTTVVVEAAEDFWRETP